MASKVQKLLQKREQLEREIAEAQATEKRKARVLQLVAELLEKHPAAVMADDKIIREKLEDTLAGIAKNLSSARVSNP